MRTRLTISLLIALAVQGMAATGVKGTLVDAKSGAPVGNANVVLSDQALFVTSGSDGVFTISNARQGKDVLEIIASGYEDAYVDVNIVAGMVSNLGDIKLTPAGFDAPALDSENYLFNEEDLLDDEGLSQNIGTIQGATDDVYYQAANYKFSTMRFRLRGYEQQWQSGYVNGFNFNDAMRGRFNYSQFGGMTSSAFRSRTTDLGMSAAAYGFGDIGGATNITTYASQFAPGWRGNLSYTNSNYMLRAMLQYSTGLNKHGWAFTASIIGRYAPEGVIEGTFYNSFGYFLSLQKVFNDKHSLNISTWGAPTQRATNAAATQEAYDLAGSNLYNPSWGYLNGKKKSSRIVESFDPTVLVNWIWKPKMGVQLNTGAGFRSSNYSSSAIQFYMAPDPKPDYYRNLPSYFKPTADRDLEPDLFAAQLAQQQYVTDWWGGDKAHRQINWDNIYQTNLMNCIQYDRDPELRGQSSYILEDRHSNFTQWMLNSYLDYRLSDTMTLQGGLSFDYTNGHYYKTVRDLLGGEFWRDVDNFSERDFAGDPDKLQNDLRYPNRRVKEGDIYRYNYNILAVTARAWIQNEWNTSHWNVNYAAEISNTNFRRDGHMQNGRFPESSLGTGESHNFLSAAVKAGATWKINSRNYITAHAGYGSRAPLISNAYVNARIRDHAVTGLKSEKFLSADLSYTWNYSNFRGSLTGFWTELWDGMQQRFFYDYDLASMMTYSLSGMQTEYKGVELGMQYQIISGLNITGTAAFTRYTYENNPTGTRSAQNGAMEDVTRTTYLKNYHVGGTPQQAYGLALNWAAPRQWFFEINANYFTDGYVDLAPTRHEEMPDLWKFCTSQEEYESRLREYAHQEHLKDAFVMNLSIGKMIYTNFGSLNFNLSINNLLNNHNIQTGGFQESKLDYTDYNLNKFPNRYYYAQGIRIFLNAGIRF